MAAGWVDPFRRLWGWLSRSVPPDRLVTIRGADASAILIRGASSDITITGAAGNAVIIPGNEIMGLSNQQIGWSTGETVGVTVPIVGAPDLSGQTAVLNLYDHNTGALVLSKPLTPNSPVQGTYACTVAHADTSGVSPRKYDFEVCRTDSGHETEYASGIATLSLSRTLGVS